jgi:hypothetical protein
MKEDKTGFFVKINELRRVDSFKGPFERLSEARNEARRIGPDLRIYYGILKNDGLLVDTSDLSLVPKTEKAR